MNAPIATIVLPVHNGATRIHLPLEALSRQIVPCGLFEVLVVDNASTDGTRQFAENHPSVILMRNHGIVCRFVQEDKPGLTVARIRGMIESRGRYVCYLDDDNIPDSNYVVNAVAALENDPKVGILISRVFPRFESPPSYAVARRQHLLAINQNLGSDRLVFAASSPKVLAPTIGAGLWFRRQAFLEAVPWRTPEQLLSDRQGRGLSSGGDIELGYLVLRAGWICYYLPELRLDHYLPKARTSVFYFCRLIIGVIRSEITLQTKYSPVKLGARERFTQLFKLTVAVMAIPMLLLRPDGIRESLFILADRWARFLGPYATVVNQHPSLHESN